MCLSVSVVRWSAYGRKPGLSCDNNIVVSAGTMDNQNVSILIPASHNADVGIFRVEYQVAGVGLGPGNGRAVAMLHPRPSAVAYDIAAAGYIVKYPIHIILGSE